MTLKRSEGNYVLKRTCGDGCPCRMIEYFTHLNMVRNHPMEKEKDPFFEGIDPPSHLPETRWINIRGREEHEAIIKDAAWCEELGLDQMYEVMVYLKRWGSWLGDKSV